MLSPRSFVWMAGPLFASAGLISCDSGSKTAVEKARLEISDKETEIDDLKSKIGKLEKDVEAAKKDDGKADAANEELKKAREENETLKGEAEDLRKENAKLKDEVTAKARSRAVGEKHDRIASPNGKVYRAVVIRKVEESGVSFGHEGGVATLDETSAPAEWVTRFGLGGNKPAPVPAADVAAAPATPAPAASSNKSSGKPAKDAAVRAKLPGVFVIRNEADKDGTSRSDVDAGKGRAFIIAQGDTTWLYTAAHVLTQGKIASVKNSEGTAVTEFGKCQIARDCDLARIEVKVNPDLSLGVVPADGATAGQEIIAVGSSGGSDEPYLLNGKITSLSPKQVEVPTSITSGGGGSPVMLTESGELIGVVCLAEGAREDVWEGGADWSQARRCTTRLDREIQWQPTTLASLGTENQRITTFDKRTQLVFAMAALQPGQSGLRLDMQVGGDKGPTILAIFEEHKDLEPVKRLVEMNKQLADKQLRSSERDLRKRFSGFHRDTLSMVAKDTATFKPETFSYVNRKEAELSMKWRKESVQLLTAAATAMGR